MAIPHALLDGAPEPPEPQPFLTGTRVAAALPPPALQDTAAPQAVAPPVLTEEVMASAVEAAGLEGLTHFRDRLAHISALSARWDGGDSGGGNSGAEGSGGLVELAALVVRWTRDANVLVTAAGLKLAEERLRTMARAAVGQDARAVATMCVAAGGRLADRKCGGAAGALLQTAARRFTLALPLCAGVLPVASGAAPVAAKAAMEWLAQALRTWEAHEGCDDDSGEATFRMATSACVAALRSPAAPTRAAAVQALAELDQHGPILAALEGVGLSGATLANVRAELGRRPHPRVCFGPPAAAAGNVQTRGATRRWSQRGCLEFESRFESGTIAHKTTHLLHSALSAPTKINDSIDCVFTQEISCEQQLWRRRSMTCGWHRIQRCRTPIERGIHSGSSFPCVEWCRASLSASTYGIWRSQDRCSRRACSPWCTRRVQLPD